MAEQRRWSDKDPILKEALELLRIQPHDTQEEMADKLNVTESPYVKSVVSNVTR